MLWIAITAAAVAPGLALLIYFYLKDRYESEPVSMVVRMFLGGALVVFPTMVMQRMLVLAFGEHPLLFAFAYSAGIEEFLKWFLLYFLIYKHVYFDEPYDGIVYAVAVSLGFATVENVIYSLLNFSSFSTLLYRAFLPVSGHALFGVAMGYYLGRAKFIRKGEIWQLILSLALPVVFHGVFDYILLGATDHWMWIMAPLMAGLWGFALWKVSKANARSPFKNVYDGRG